MTVYYVDTSALAKRYLAEIGSAWVRALAAPAAGNVVIICDLTPVEFCSLLARRQRENSITPANAVVLQSRFLADYEREYLSLPLEGIVLRQARDLVTRYPLRSLDAIQLASAIEARTALGGPLIFVAGDTHLLAAASSEGFQTDNPNNHP